MHTRARFSSAALIALGVFVLYAITLSPSTAMWDAGEYIAAAKSLGIPHQPGNPVFILVAHVAGMIPVSDSYAVRINLLAALSSAIVAGLWFLCAERLLRSSIEDLRARLVASVAATLLGATAFTVWNQSVVMEKVYPLALVGLALVSWLMLVWLDTADPRRADRLLVLMAYLVGLGYAVHPAGLLTAPALAAAVIRHRPRTLLRPKLLALLAAACFVGMTPFAVLPIRAAYQPFINESAVSACEDGTLRADCTFSAETARRLVGTIQREQYGGNPVLVRRSPFVAQVQMFWLYFKWQWLRDLPGSAPLTQSLVAAAMLILGIFGIAALKRGPPRSSDRAQHTGAGTGAQFWYFATLTGTFTIALIYYLNFRYGWSQSPELGDLVPREPRDRDYFYMWTFSLWGLLAGIGLASFIHGGEGRPPGRTLALRSAALLALALGPLVANYDSASRRGRSFTSEWAADMLNSVEPNAILITEGDNDSFPLWYAQEVEGIRRDVTVALTPYLNMDWYARQLNKRSVGNDGAGMWRLSDQELDTVPPYIQPAQQMQFQHGRISAPLPQLLTRGQLLVLRAIKDSFPNRPIYFSFGQYAQTLGLEPYIKRVGLVQKLEDHPIQEDPDSVRMEGGYVDVPRSLALWKRYRGAHQLAREGTWVDAASAQVPMYYALVGRDLAMALEARGDSAQAREVIELARKAADVVR